jgi:hypothetical protein
MLLTLAIFPAGLPVHIFQKLHTPTSGLKLIAAFVLPYLVYAAGTTDFRWSGLARLLAVCAPLLLYSWAPVRDASRLYWQDCVAWTWLTLIVVFRKFNGIWNVPANLDFMARLLVIGVAAWCWVVLRPVPDLKYRFALTARSLAAAGLAFAGFAVVALPLSFATGFARWNSQWLGAASFLETFVEIFILIAWLEELLFRGFLQSILERTLMSPAAGQVLASIAFGFSHILLGQAPNWRYVLMASIAGWFYGFAFRQGGGLLIGPAITHALVDTVWRTWFRGVG